MTETSNQQKSKFIASFRLKPSKSFAGLQAKIVTGDGYELSFQDDMVWVQFEATSGEWLQRLNIGRQALKTILAILAIQTEYAFDLEPIQWIEDKPRDKASEANYVLGRLGADLTVQKEPPSVKIDDIRRGGIYFHLASHNARYRYALLDYSVALSFPHESIVFCARSVEWVKSHFGTRTLMRNELFLPREYVTQFFKIANETVIARHAGDPRRIRSPNIEEVRFCIVFNRVVLDYFALYLWHSLSSDLPQRWKYPADEKSPVELLEARKAGLTKMLGQILSGELS